MILEKETFEKFGYFPKNLKDPSRNPILKQCEKCFKILIIKNCSRKSKSSPNCRKCVDLNLGKKRRAKLNDYVPFTNIELCNFLFSGCIRELNDYQKYLIVSTGKRSKLVVPATYILRLEKQLNIKRKELNTIILKQKLKNYLLNLEVTEIFEIVNYIFSNKTKLSKGYFTNENNTYRYTFSDLRNIICPFLNKLNFKFTDVNKTAYKLLTGSFYVNNNWIHIG